MGQVSARLPRPSLPLSPLCKPSSPLSSKASTASVPFMLLLLGALLTFRFLLLWELLASQTPLCQDVVLCLPRPTG